MYRYFFSHLWNIMMTRLLFILRVERQKGLPTSHLHTQLDRFAWKLTIYACISGKRDGQTMMIRRDNKVEAHQWTAAEGRWVKIGDVTGGESGEGAAGGKKTFKGKVS